MRLVVTAVVAAAVVAATQAPRAAPSTPIIVELFTSEGCSSCPPADTLLESLVNSQPISGAQVIGLGLHVDYWDQLGWKDRFSSAALTHRQQLYGTRFNRQSIYTPQMVVDGRAEFVGSDANAARKAIGRALDVRHGVVRIAIQPPAADRLSVSVTASELPRGTGGPSPLIEDHLPGGASRLAALLLPQIPVFSVFAPGHPGAALRNLVLVQPRRTTSDHGDIVVAITEDHLRSDVKRGENHGRTLTHAAVVRHLAAIGEAANEGATSARADILLARYWQREHLNIVAFVQERRSRTILASAVATLPAVR